MGIYVFSFIPCDFPSLRSHLWMSSSFCSSGVFSSVFPPSLLFQCCFDDKMSGCALGEQWEATVTPPEPFSLYLKIEAKKPLTEPVVKPGNWQWHVISRCWQMIDKGYFQPIASAACAVTHPDLPSLFFGIQLFLQNLGSQFWLTQVSICGGRRSSGAGYRCSASPADMQCAFCCHLLNLLFSV